MGKALRPGLLILIVAALAILLTWMWRDPDPAVRPDEPAAGAPRGTEAEIEADGGLDIANWEREVATAPEPEPRPPDEGPVLRVRLRGLVAGAAWTTPLKLDLEGRNEARDQWQDHEARAEVTADGTARFELPHWTTVATRQRGRLEAEDPNYRPLLHRFEGSIDTGEVLVLDVQVIAVLEGRVVDVRGKPVMAARVTAFAIENGSPVEPQVGSTSTSREGTYHIEVAPGVPLLLVATPMQPVQLSGRTLTGRHGAIADLGIVRADLLPAACEVHGALGATTDVSDLVARDAACIRGVVQWPGGAPIEQVKIGMANGAGVAVSANVGVGRSADGSLSISSATFTDERGEFELPATPGQRVELLVLSIPKTFLFADVTTTVIAPTRTTITVPAPIRLRPRAAARKVQRAIIEHDRGGARPCDDDGGLDVIISMPLRVRASLGRLSSPWQEIVPEQAGRTIDLHLSESSTEITIAFTGQFPVRNATFRWERDDGSGGSQRAVRGDASGLFLLHLAPGSYRLRVGPSPGERNGLYLLPLERRIDVGTTDMRLDLPAVFGGRFTVHATDGSGRYVAGSCRVRDAAGQDRTDRFVSHNGGGSKVGEHGELLPDGPNEFASILPPGDYELEFGFASHGPERRVVSVRPREVTDVRVRLP